MIFLRDSGRQRSTINPMVPVDDQVDCLLASVLERFDDIVASEAVARAFAVACRNAASVSRETRVHGLDDAGRMESITSAFDEALKTELRRLLQTH